MSSSNNNHNKGTKKHLKFPCEFPIKAMGKNHDYLQDIVLKIVQKHSPETKKTQLTCNYSSNGNYVSITINLKAKSQQQLDKIYIDLSACKDLSYVI